MTLIDDKTCMVNLTLNSLWVDWLQALVNKTSPYDITITPQNNKDFNIKIPEVVSNHYV